MQFIVDNQCTKFEKVKQRELLLQAIERKKNAEDEALWQIFCYFDKGCDGFIFRQDLQMAILFHKSDINHSMFDRLFKEYGFQGNQISYDDFVNFMNCNFYIVANGMPNTQKHSSTMSTIPEYSLTPLSKDFGGYDRSASNLSSS